MKTRYSVDVNLPESDDELLLFMLDFNMCHNSVIEEITISSLDDGLPLTDISINSIGLITSREKCVFVVELEHNDLNKLPNDISLETDNYGSYLLTK